MTRPAADLPAYIWIIVGLTSLMILLLIVLILRKKYVVSRLYGHNIIVHTNMLVLVELQVFFKNFLLVISIFLSAILWRNYGFKVITKSWTSFLFSLCYVGLNDVSSVSS